MYNVFSTVIGNEKSNKIGAKKYTFQFYEATKRWHVYEIFCIFAK